MEQPLMLQNECVDCPFYEGFGQCYHYGNITGEIQKGCLKELIDNEKKGDEE